MARGDNQINLRVKDGLKAQIIASAKANNRSMNAEITYQLECAYRASYIWHSATVDFPKYSEVHDEIVRMDSMAGNS